ncbi:MAG: polyketide synthase dehydratase domain-containing protein, partial [Bryobacteraceae bacterium]
KSVERAGRNGCSATLEALSHAQLFTDNPQPAFLFDPVLLDAAGQVVAYWFWEAIEKGTDLFPYRVGAFHCYAPAPPTGTLLECRVLRRFESDAVIHSDIEVLDHAGKVYYRLDNWETRRFPQPPLFLRLRIDPRATYISTPWKEPVAGKRGVACCRVEGLPQPFLESSHSVWLKTLAALRGQRCGAHADPGALRRAAMRRGCGDRRRCIGSSFDAGRLEAAAGSQSRSRACQFRHRGRGGCAECGRSGRD